MKTGHFEFGSQYIIKISKISIFIYEIKKGTVLVLCILNECVIDGAGISMFTIKDSVVV